MSDTLDVVRRAAVSFEPSADGLDALLDSIGDARLVLVGEATHGTHEFYSTRAALTKALILQQGFNIVALEADWPDAYRVNRWMRHASGEADVPRFQLLLDNSDVRRALRSPRLARAIGVIYRPETERVSHYFHATLPEQFDAVLHMDETRAIEPLEPWSRHQGRPARDAARAPCWVHQARER